MQSNSYKKKSTFPKSGHDFVSRRLSTGKGRRPSEEQHLTDAMERRPAVLPLLGYLWPVCSVRSLGVLLSSAKKVINSVELPVQVRQQMCFRGGGKSLRFEARHTVVTTTTPTLVV